MRDSLWYHQVGKRAERLTKMMQDSSVTSDQYALTISNPMFIV